MTTLLLIIEVVLLLSLCWDKIVNAGVATFNKGKQSQYFLYLHDDTDLHIEDFSDM